MCECYCTALFIGLARNACIDRIYRIFVYLVISLPNIT